jgi:hypothetical protein
VKGAVERREIQGALEKLLVCDETEPNRKTPCEKAFVAQTHGHLGQPFEQNGACNISSVSRTRE